MSKEVHYEYYLKKGPHADWELVDIFQDRNLATNEAKLARLQSEYYSVRVTKETHDTESGGYLSVHTLEEGPETYGKTRDAKNKAHLPCSKAEDLYTTDARKTITRVLSDFLTRENICANELIHRADLVEKLEASGTDMQHAIQKYAIAYAGEKNQPVQELMRMLNEMTSAATKKLYVDARQNIFPQLSSKNIASEVSHIVNSPQADYLFAGGITQSLRDKPTWAEKLSTLLSFAKALEKTPHKGFFFAALDDFIADIFEMPTGLADLFGEHENLGHYLLFATDVYNGKANTHDFASAELKALSQYFQAKAFPHARDTLMKHILAELRSVKRLQPQSIQEDVSLGNALLTNILASEGINENADAVETAFLERSKRLLVADVIEPYLKETASPDAQIKKILQLEENIIGAENKQKLADYLLPIVRSHKCEKFYLNSEGPILKRLSALTALQTRILNAGFNTAEQRELASAIDNMAVTLEDRAKLLISIDKKTTDLMEKTLLLLRICSNNVLTQGECLTKAQRQVVRYMRCPAFKEAAQKGAEDGDPQVDEIKELLNTMDLSAVREHMA